MARNLHVRASSDNKYERDSGVNLQNNLKSRIAENSPSNIRYEASKENL